LKAHNITAQENAIPLAARVQNLLKKTAQRAEIPHHTKRRRRHRAGGGENDVSTSCQPKREGPAARLFRQGSGEGQATAPQARKQQPRQSQVSTLTRFAWNRCVFMCQFNPKQRTILQVMEWIADLTSAS